MTATEILFLAHRLPWPPDRGDRIRSWHMLEALAKLRPVHVVAPIDDGGDRQHIARVEAVAASVTTAVRPASKGQAMARALVTGRPASVELFSLPTLHRAVRDRLARGSIGTVFAFSGQMAHYVPRGTDAKFIMDFVDMDSAKFAQQGAAARGLAGVALRHEAKRLAAFEMATARRADAAIFVSRAEAAVFTAATGLPALAIENGVDAARFAPGTVGLAEAPHPLIVFTGQMDYAPNVEGVTAFAHEVLPLLPTACFAIVGRAPTAAVRALAAPNVVVTGEVADTRPWLAAADVVVAPLALARGIQNKVLEAMAMGRPVVASSAAAEGIDAEAGTELLVADSPAAQAEAIAALLTDPRCAGAVGAAARNRVCARYSWAACLAPLAELVA